MEEARHSKIHRGNVRYCRRATRKMSINQRNGGLHARREIRGMGDYMLDERSEEWGTTC